MEAATGTAQVRAVKKNHLTTENGFSLVEVILAVAVSGMIVIIAGEALLSHVRTSVKMEGLERQRSDWTRTTFFIDAEVSLSQEVLTGSALTSLALPSSCTEMSTSNLLFALRVRPDLPLVFYSIEDSRTPWLPPKSIYRCGPEIDTSGSYSSTNYGSSLLVDGVETNGFRIDSSRQNPPMLYYTLALKGLAQNSYIQQTASIGRAVPSYIRPDITKICTSATPPPGSTGITCNGAAGSAANDIIESFSAIGINLTDPGGNNRLLGSSGADTLTTSNGDDVLIGLAGNDTLSGGGGYNRYVPGTGNDTVNGGSGVDVVFFTGNKSLFNLANCKKSSCTVSSSAEGTDTLKSSDILVFDDQSWYVPD